MKQIKYIIFGLTCLLLASCQKGFLDRKMTTDFVENQVFNSYSRIRDFGIGMYTYVPTGYNRIDGAMIASASDEAEFAYTGSSIQKYNIGSWSPYSNPDECWNYYYSGIRSTNMFLEKSVNYKAIIYRDTITVTGKQSYKVQVADLTYLRAEARFLRAMFYFELNKRYGGVPIITKTLTIEDDLKLPRNSYEEVVNFITSECDGAISDGLIEKWEGVDDKSAGRATKGAALALKSRVLLYAASPQNNPANDKSKWVAAAAAANQVIALKQYALFNNYRNLFLPPNTYKSTEVIFARRDGAGNGFERANYPIGYEGGTSGTCPSANLVDSYEKLTGWDATKPYDKRDPRLQLSILVNNTTWKGRPVECWTGGKDGKGKDRATKTGFYMKKYVDESLDLLTDKTSIHCWILFRYGETLLNYAESMNEAYGPNSDPSGYGITAVGAINMVRQRPGVVLPAIATTITYADFKMAIMNERRVELAFEEHRYWDVRRWKIAEQTLGAPLMGVEIIKNADATFTYNPIEVEKRVFVAKMYMYPIQQNEILKSNGKLIQNPGWN